MSFHEGSNWQANKEDKNEPLYTVEKLKFLFGKEKPFFIDTFRNLLRQYDKEEISMSKFVEVLNLEALEWHNKLLNKEQEDKRSVATMPNSSTSPDPQNAQKEPVIDKQLLVSEFYDTIVHSTSYDQAAEDCAEFVLSCLKSKGEPVIDWGELKDDFIDFGLSLAKDAWPSEYYNWLKSNLTNYIKADR